MMRAISQAIRRVFTPAGNNAFVATAMIGGMIAFAWAGFLGNPNDARLVIKDPWPLFLWICYLMVALQLIILARLGSSRPRKLAVIAVTILWILVVIAVTILWILVVVVLRLAGASGIAGLFDCRRENG